MAQRSCRAPLAARDQRRDRGQTEQDGRRGPIVRELRDALDLCPQDRLTFIAQARGRPLDAASLGNQFRDWLQHRGLPSKLSLHGLRKAAARRLAEAGWLFGARDRGNHRPQKPYPRSRDRRRKPKRPACGLRHGKDCFDAQGTEIENLLSKTWPGLSHVIASP
jgi:hypothetical protein